MKMNKNELDFVLQEGEGLKVEFKESLDKSLAKEIVAFANSKGGRIFLGVDDRGKIIGLDLTNSLKSQIANIAANCDSKINAAISSFEDVAIIEVQESNNKPHKCSTEFYLRQGASSVKLTREEIISLVNEEGMLKYDETANKDFKYPADFDKKKLNEYLARAHINGAIPTEKLLEELGASKGRKFTNAGILFFAKNPQRFVSHSVYSCVLFKDKEGANIIDRKEADGSLIGIVEDVMKFIEKNIRVAYQFTGKPERENIYEYPMQAIREAVVNSVMHRDYYESGHNNIIKIYPDKIVITNVWIKPSWFKIGRDTFRRNRIIADMFLRVGFIEKLGTGFERMKNFCKKANSDFMLDADQKYFRIEFFKSKDYLKLAEKTVEETVEKILQIVKDNPRITQKELSEKTGLSRRGIEWNLQQLKDKGILKRIGPDKGGYWKVISKKGDMHDK